MSSGSSKSSSSSVSESSASGPCACCDCHGLWEWQSGNWVWIRNGFPVPSACEFEEDPEYCTPEFYSDACDALPPQGPPDFDGFEGEQAWVTGLAVPEDCAT
jgi:hypothetical protein